MQNEQATQAQNGDLSKELAPIKTQVSQSVQVAHELEIKTPEDLNEATALLGQIKQIGKMITSKKNSMTKPLNEALRNIRSFFAPVEKEYKEAEGIVKTKMIAFNTAQQAKAAKKTEQVEQKVEAGKMSFDKAAETIEKVTPQKNVTTDEGAAQFRTIKEVVIDDLEKLPREYMVPDMVKIRKVALAGVDIPGVKVVEKQTVAGITK